VGHEQTSENEKEMEGCSRAGAFCKQQSDEWRSGILPC